MRIICEKLTFGHWCAWVENSSPAFPETSIALALERIANFVGIETRFMQLDTAASSAVKQVYRIQE